VNATIGCTGNSAVNSAARRLQAIASVNGPLARCRTRGELLSVENFPCRCAASNFDFAVNNSNSCAGNLRFDHE
jgi:hypothetical protein